MTHLCIRNVYVTLQSRIKFLMITDHVHKEKYPYKSWLIMSKGETGERHRQQFKFTSILGVKGK